MKILGIEFAPLRLPLQRRLQTLGAGGWFLTLAFGGFVGTFLNIYLLFTRFWWVGVLYVVWIYLDRTTCEKGGRPVLWVKKWGWWYHMKHYFPSRLETVPDLTLDSKRNYLFCCYPHGILPAGPFSNIGTYYSEFREKFPDFTVHMVVLSQQFIFPFLRELSMSIGCISSSAASLNHVMSRPEGGQVACLMPGGAVEAYNSQPGRYKIVVKKRKGFVKLAIRNGSPIVPVLSFGELDLFEQIEGPTLRKVQEYIRGLIGLAPIVFSGRGFFQYSFGVIPRRKPIVTVVGRPIDVTKTENPSREEIDKLHEKFVQELVNLFEEYKGKYVENPENTHLELE